MTLNEIASKFPQWSRETQITAWLADMRREVGGETMAATVDECFNSTESDVSEDGSVWICNPQTGHWANDLELESLVEFVEAQVA